MSRCSTACASLSSRKTCGSCIDARVIEPARRGWRIRGLWRHRDFLFLWGAQGISSIGSRGPRTALPMAAILVAGASAIDLGILAVALTLPGVLVAWLAGGW